MATAGKTLGPYELVSLVGAGGMGEVWRARDPRLGREVAVKILPASFSSDADRLRRFEQEARAAAGLSHPNILSVYDVGTQNGSPYIVTELLQGESLRETLRNGALPIRKSIEFAIQIARGLAAAHEKGIVHRDLKPDNVFVTKDGQLKLLDFGLAKLLDQPTVSDRTSVPTMDHGTTPGMVLGTMGYMSPEQVRGRDIDHRSDIFSFGAILYEMVSGRRAFHGETTADTLSAILREDPPELSATGKLAPAALERIIRHCLEKSPEQRFQSARDIAFDLEALSTVSTGTAQAIAGGVNRRKLTFAVVGTSGLLLVAIAAFFAGHGLRPAEAAKLKRLTFRNGSIAGARFSPDGHTAYYSATWAGGTPEIYSVSDSAPGSQSVGVHNAQIMAVTRTGELLVLLDVQDLYGTGHTTEGTLARVPTGGGAPRPELEHVGAADASPDGTTLAISRYLPERHSFQLEYPVGKVLYQAPGYMDGVRISPDGEYVAFLDHPALGDDRGAVAMVDRGGKYTKLVEGGFGSLTGLAWRPNGELWFSEYNGLHAMKLGGKDRMIATDTAVPHLQDVDAEGRALVAARTYRYGIIAQAPGAKERDISWLDWPAVTDISSDGKRVLFNEDGAGGVYSLFLGYSDGSPPLRLGHGDASKISPDGKWVSGTSVADTAQVMVFPTGAGEPREITNGKVNYRDCWWHPAGQRLYCTGKEPGHGFRTYAVDVASGKSDAVTPEGMLVYDVSPDGAYLLAPNRQLWKLDGNAPVPIKGIAEGEEISQFTTDNSVFALRREEGVVHVTSVNPLTGARKPLRDIVAPALAGYYAQHPVFTRDGRGYAYRYRLIFDDLYLVTGGN